MKHWTQRVEKIQARSCVLCAVTFSTPMPTRRYCDECRRAVQAARVKRWRQRQLA